MHLRHARRLIAPFVGVLLAAFIAGSWPVAAAEPAPGGVTIDARALLDGNARPGSWTAVDVTVSNDGPTISGELRIRSSQQGRSRYGVLVELANGARQVHTLYAQPPIFGSRLHVDLVRNGATILTQDVPITTHEVYAPIVGVVAERPEGILPGLREVARRPNSEPATIVQLGLDDLPQRPEAWSAIDRLVWQDVDPALLSAEQLEALRVWVAAGGRLVIVAGTTGVGPFHGFPEDLLPFVPSETVTVESSELTSLLADAPTGASEVALTTGNLTRGSAIGITPGGRLIAAQVPWGQGTVTVVGINPGEPWLADTSAADGLWSRLVPLGTLNPLLMPDDSTLVAALNNLPSVQLPPIEQLFLLLVAYIVLIGPINYLVLRRLDRREWAWLTMPAIVAIFAVASYGMGARLKGSDVIVNEVAVVRAGDGTDEGLGQVYVGIFSPTRRSFDVRVPGGALLSNPVSQMQFGQGEQALDVLFGDPSRLRNFEVGFGVVRGFRAEAPVPAPVVEADLRLVNGRLEGTVRNNSASELEHTAVIYAGGAAILGRMAPNETRTLAIDTSDFSFGYALSERVFGSVIPRDPNEARLVTTRRSVLDQLTGYEARLVNGSPDKPVLLAWRRGPVLDVELAGEQPNRVGDSLYLVALPVVLDGPALFTDRLMEKNVLDVSGDGSAEGPSFYLGRGTMTVEARPVSLDGNFRATVLEMALTEGTQPLGEATEIEPLPEAEQPDQDDPVGGQASGVEAPIWQQLPNLQLFEHAAGRWLEFPALDMTRTYRIKDPARFVDATGRVLARFVNRGLNQQTYFSWTLRLEGAVE